MSEEKVKAVEAEVQRLQDAQVIREVKYPSGWPTLYQSRRKMESGECVWTSQI
jgi:hypothetical protein